MKFDISIADLIKPKFECGQKVFHVSRDYQSKPQHITPRTIETILFIVEIRNDKGVHSRTPKLIYRFHGGVEESCQINIVAKLDDLPECDRKL